MHPHGFSRRAWVNRSPLQCVSLDEGARRLAEDVVNVTAGRTDKVPAPEVSSATSTVRPLGPTHLRILFARLTRIGFPRRFPIVQFPNAPLIVALVSGQIAEAVRGMAHAYFVSIAYLAMTVW